MGLRLLLDANLSPRVATGLRSAGHHARHVAELGLLRASDRTILEHALGESRIIVTFDLDFAALLAASPSRELPSAIILRLPSARPEAVLPRIRAALDHEAVSLRRGAVLVVELERIRVRHLGP